MKHAHKKQREVEYQYPKLLKRREICACGATRSRVVFLGDGELSTFTSWGKLRVEKRVRPKLGRAPDVGGFKRYQQQLTTQLMDEHIRPYCQSLLDDAQRRLRTRIRFVQGMGSVFFATDDPGEPRRRQVQELTEAALSARERPAREWRLAERFSELTEIIRIAQETEEELDAVVGDLVPTTPPRPYGRCVPAVAEGDVRET
jgi:hypothetical protein